MTGELEFETKWSGDQRVHQSERTACRVVEGKAMVITIDSNKLHVLNSVATRVWELADGRPMTELVDDIVNEFEVDRRTASADVEKFVVELLGLGALEARQLDSTESTVEPLRRG